MNNHLEIIDAFVDGERVDTAALKSVLSTVEGRDYLVDAWLLREGVQESVAAEPMAPVTMQSHTRARGVPWAIAASITIVALTSGYFLGGRLAAPAPTAPSNATPAVTEAAPPATSFPMPQPTKIIRLDMAAKDASGGN